MEHNSRTTPRAGGATLWTPWGPVPDPSARDGKVTRLRPREQAVRHKRIGFDVRPRDALPSKQ
jgi:hypothetical protein